MISASSMRVARRASGTAHRAVAHTCENLPLSLGTGSARLARLSTATLCLAGLFFSGCSQFNNPFRDELRHQAEVTTPSVEGIRAMEATKATPHREYAPSYMVSHDAPVLHAPLLFESKYEELINDDGQFAWTLEDYWDFAYWRGRFLVNLVAVPVSMIVTPPCSIQESDGELEPNWFGELHDAKTSPCQNCARRVRDDRQIRPVESNSTTQG